MKISLITGKVIDIPTEKYLEFTEEEYEDFIQRMVSADAGLEINDPFSEDIFYPDSNEVLLEDIPIEPLPEEIIEEIIKETKNE